MPPKNNVKKRELVYDSELGSKLRQISQELLDWHQKAKQQKLKPNDIERMKFESEALQRLITSREL